MYEKENEGPEQRFRGVDRMMQNTYSVATSYCTNNVTRFIEREKASRLLLCSSADLGCHRPTFSNYRFRTIPFLQGDVIATLHTAGRILR